MKLCPVILINLRCDCDALVILSTARAVSRRVPGSIFCRRTRRFFLGTRNCVMPLWGHLKQERERRNRKRCNFAKKFHFPPFFPRRAFQIVIRIYLKGDRFLSSIFFFIFFSLCLSLCLSLSLSLSLSFLSLKSLVWSDGEEDSTLIESKKKVPRRKF
jgi:hypothetical protein